MPVNRSAKLVRAINDGEIQLPRGADVQTAILKTSWLGAAEEIPALLEKHRPDFALHFGVANSAQGFRIEKTAHNRTCSTPDVHGKFPEMACIRTEGPEQLECKVNTASLVASLKKERLPASISNNAGDYLCNMLFYMSLIHSELSGNLQKSLFVHIPPTGHILPKNDLFTGVQIILRECMTDPIVRTGTVRTA